MLQAIMATTTVSFSVSKRRHTSRANAEHAISIRIMPTPTLPLPYPPMVSFFFFFCFSFFVSVHPAGKSFCFWMKNKYYKAGGRHCPYGWRGRGGGPGYRESVGSEGRHSLSGRAQGHPTRAAGGGAQLQGCRERCRRPRGVEGVQQA